MEISLWDEKNGFYVVKEEESFDSAEGVTASLCRRLGIRPASAPLFQLYCPITSSWIVPDRKVPRGQLVQLRLRFKVPSPARLLRIDRRAFLYYYAQVREDFRSGLVTTESSKRSSSMTITSSTISSSSSTLPSLSSRTWLPILPEIRSEKYGKSNSSFHDHYVIATKLISLNMIIDMVTMNVTLKEVLKNIGQYAPKGIWLGAIDRLFGQERLKTNARNLITTWRSQNKTEMALKLEFVTQVEERYPLYYDEVYPETVLSRQYESKRVTLVIRPPFLSAIDPSIEREPTLAFDSTVICSVEEICNISSSSYDHDCGKNGDDDEDKEEEIEVSRKNGVPVYFKFHNQRQKFDVLTGLCGYYRLSEKWIFSLCNDIVYPSLRRLLKSNIHGPVRRDFVDKKFAEKCSKGGISYIVNMDPETYDRYYLHVHNGKNRTMTYTISQNDKGFKVTPLVEGIEGTFDDIHDLIGALARKLELRRCLHPSEFDKDPGLLLCRAIKQLQLDVSQPNQQTSTSSFQNTIFIPFRSLSRYENEKFPGKFTNVWKGQWLRNKNVRQIVAIKQLKSELETIHLKAFSNMSNKVMCCQDSTLVDCLGFCPSYENEPAAIVMEYFPLGPLDVYLRKNREVLTQVELLEAAACLARALWYLSEQRIIHGHIRCRSAFVFHHDEDSFKVKLGDPGLPDYCIEKDVHWLPVETLSSSGLDGETPEGDVWAYATTVWEIFSYGSTPLPHLTPFEARDRYLRGDRLQRPLSLRIGTQLSQVYEIMSRCWFPDPTLRCSPQKILKDINQLFYRVYNSRNAHNYVTIREEGCGSEDPTIGSYDGEDDLVPIEPSRERGPRLHYNLFPMYDKSSLSCGSEEPLLRTTTMTTTTSFDGSVSEIHSQETMSSVYTYYSQSSVCTSIYSLGEHQLELNRECPIGHGHFGIVFRGTISKSDGDWDEVAVKMLKNAESLSYDAYRDMQMELELMKELRHDNVVKIKGTLEDDRSRVIIIMEYLKEGSLDKYVVTHKETLKRDHGIRLFKFASDIAEGMEYLANKSIIHRDLAARNILVADEDTVKISDFGLARVSSDYYIMSSTSNIPVKWLAPECLTMKRYSTASDVWAFGVTLWEMFSYGLVPNLIGCERFFDERDSEDQHFANMQKLVELLIDGQRLPKPDECSVYIYNELMLPCWDRNPEKRPDFTQLKNMISSVELKVT